MVDADGLVKLQTTPLFPARTALKLLVVQNMPVRTPVVQAGTVAFVPVEFAGKVVLAPATTAQLSEGNVVGGPK